MLWNDNKSSSNLDLKITDDLVLNTDQERTAPWMECCGLSMSCIAWAPGGTVVGRERIPNIWVTETTGAHDFSQLFRPQALNQRVISAQFLSWLESSTVASGAPASGIQLVLTIPYLLKVGA